MEARGWGEMEEEAEGTARESRQSVRQSRRDRTRGRRKGWGPRVRVREWNLGLDPSLNVDDNRTLTDSDPQYERRGRAASVSSSDGCVCFPSLSATTGSSSSTRFHDARHRHVTRVGT